MTWAQTSFADFYVHMWLPSICLVLVVWWLRRCGGLRPSTASLWSLDLALFQLVRWPWTTWGFFEGMWAGRREVPKPYRVTPKDAKGLQPTQRPAAGTAARTCPVAGRGAVDRGRPAGDTRARSRPLVQTLVYCAAAAIVTLRHVQSNRRRRTEGPQGVNLPRLLTWGTGGAAVAATAGTVAIACLGLATLARIDI